MTSSEQWVEVKLIGELGRRFGRQHRFFVRHPRDVISALARQIEGFKDYLSTAHENGVAFRLVTDDPKGIGYEHLELSCQRLVIAPIMAGAGGQGFSIGQILLGVALVALAFIPGVGIAASGALAGKMTALGTVLFSLGTGLVLTGISGLLSPQVQTPTSDTSKKESFIFDRSVELTTQGYPIPLVYGQYLVTSPLYVSSAISTEAISV